MAARSPFGWGHTIDFGPFEIPGLLGKDYLGVAALLREWGWVADLTGKRCADVGCFSGGLSLFLAAQGAAEVHAVDEVPEHVEQCRLVSGALGCRQIQCHQLSLYEMPREFSARSFDLILLSGVLYHLSDMLVGLYALRELLRDDGVLLVETNAVPDMEHSYANYGRFYGGMWWQPTGLCIQDMCEHMGFQRPEVRFYAKDRCLARAAKQPGEITFKRGLNWKFPDIHDTAPRPYHTDNMAPAPREKASSGTQWPAKAVPREPANSRPQLQRGAGGGARDPARLAPGSPARRTLPA